jgi:MoaA/NifB/PqqE/SkfB family radical SAM enzyme
MYCNIQNTNRDELTLDEWKKAILIIKELGANELVILGGEPTLYPNIIELVDYIVNDLKMVCNLTTNAFDNFETVKKLIDVGLNSIGVSIDNLEIKDSISPLKAKNGMKLIEYLMNNCEHPNITNYTVLNKNNVDSVIDLIKYMSEKGVSTYILPFHWGNEGTFDHRKNNEKYAFVTDDEIKQYRETIDKIIAMKNGGYKIKNSFEFLEESKKHIKKLDWKCSGLSELRIDSDGRLVCCCDKIGSVNNKFTIFNLKENLEKFYESREEDSSKCNGCLWPSSFEAELKKRH